MKPLLSALIFSLSLIGSLLAQDSEHHSSIRDMARVFHSEEIEELTQRLNDLEKRTGVPISLKILDNNGEYAQAIDFWNSTKKADSKAPLSILALVDYASNPDVVIRSRTNNPDLNTQEIRQFLDRVQESASLSTNPKTSVQILIAQLEDEIPFILKRVKGKKKLNLATDAFHKEHRKSKILSLFIPLLILFTILGLSAVAYFLYRKKQALHFPEPQWHPRLGAPYSGGNNALAQPSIHNDPA